MNIEEFNKIDTTFNEDMFLSKVNNIVVKLFTGIMLDDLETVRHFINQAVYDYSLDIINKAKDNNCRQMFDEFNVKNSRIMEIKVNNGVYTIKVFLQLRYMDYIISLDNGNLVSGNNNARVERNYIFTFEKDDNAKQQDIVRKCPGCGASLDVNNSGKCEYCGTIYNQEDYDWVLTKVENS